MTVHLITAWSARDADETPRCGASRAETFNTRTISLAHVTCPACKAIAASEQESK
jgi:hypothetical protein